MKTAYFVLILAALAGTATCLFRRVFIYVKATKNWTHAQTYCRNRFVDLASITSQAEQDMFSIKAESLTVWIGLSRDPAINNVTQWSDGSALHFKNWADVEQSAVLPGFCVTAYASSWYVQECTTVLQFFCFKWEPQVFVVHEMKTWDEALKHCKTYYTNLISLPKKRDLQLSKNKTSDVQTPSFWIGLRFLDGQWYWVNKEPLGNLVSLPSCPVPHLRCGAKQTGEDVFENRDCEEKRNFVCYD